jgi:hypothetical protein
MNTSENAIPSWGQLFAEQFVCHIVSIDAIQSDPYFFSIHRIYNC